MLKSRRFTRPISWRAETPSLGGLFEHPVRFIKYVVAK
jgi:hypothetical protein